MHAPCRFAGRLAALRSLPRQANGLPPPRVSQHEAAPR